MAVNVLAYYFERWEGREIAQRSKPRARNAGGPEQGSSAGSRLSQCVGWAICLSGIHRMQKNKKMLKMKIAPNNLLKTKGRETTYCPSANDSLKTHDLSENANDFMKTNQIS
jgi:hypothetical protein